MSNSTRGLAEGAMAVALSTMLSFVSLYRLPQGGDITAFSMLPIILNSYRNGPRWGIFAGFVYAMIQLLLGINNVMICPTLLAQIGCILLDYIIPYAMLGSACLFARPFKNKLLGIGVSTGIVCMIRYLCSFLSGIILWGSYAPPGTPVWIYSLVYNGSYMIPETVLTILASVLIYRSAKRLFVRQV